MADFPEVATQRIVDSVYDHLRNLIIRHELRPGAHLSVPALAEKFGVSRSPVREAVLLAVRDGLAVEKPRSGAFVASFKAADLEPLFEVREALEGMAARLAAARQDAASISGLHENLKAQENALAGDRLEDFVEHDIAFHWALLEASGNKPLIDTLGHLYVRINLALKMRAAPAGPNRAFADHETILKAVDGGDPDAAEAAARLHIRNAIVRLHQRAEGDDTPDTGAADDVR